MIVANRFQLTPGTKKDLAYGFLLGLLTILALSMLGGCTNMPSRARTASKDSMWGSVAIGPSQTKGKTEDFGSLSGDGMAVSLRGEISTPVEDFKNVEAGLRVGITGRDAQAEPDGVPVNAESGEISAVGVLRGLFPVTQVLSVYGEGFGGYAHNFGNLEGGPIDVSDNGGGLMFGAGAGLDFGTGFRIGLEWSRREFDIEPVEIRSDDIMLVIGGSFRF